MCYVSEVSSQKWPNKEAWLRKYGNLALQHYYVKEYTEPQYYPIAWVKPRDDFNKEFEKEDEKEVCFS